QATRGSGQIGPRLTAPVIRFNLNPAPDFANAMTTESASSPSAPASAKTAAAEPGAISPAQAQLVLDVTRMLAVTTDLDALLTHIAQAACGLLDCERASIFLYDQATNRLCTKVALQTTEIRVPCTAGIVGAA